MTQAENTSRTTMAEILAVLTELATTHGMPTPESLRINSSNGIVGISCRTRADLDVWTAVLGGETARCQPHCGGLLHNSFADRDGWMVQLSAVTADEPADESTPDLPIVEPLTTEQAVARVKAWMAGGLPAGEVHPIVGPYGRAVCVQLPDDDTESVDVWALHLDHAAHTVHDDEDHYREVGPTTHRELPGWEIQAHADYGDVPS